MNSVTCFNLWKFYSQYLTFTYKTEKKTCLLSKQDVETITEQEKVNKKLEQYELSYYSEGKPCKPVELTSVVKYNK